MIRDQALSAANEIEEAILQAVPSPEDHESMRRIKSALSTLRTLDLSFGYLREKLVAIDSMCEVFFSARKHEKYGGPDAVRHLILMDVASLKLLISRLN